MTKQSSVKPANPKPCAACPWRLANQGRKDVAQPHFYQPANLRRLWKGVRAGARMSCHPTDPRMSEWEGYEDCANREVTHECAGSLILQQREFMRFQEYVIAQPEAKRGSLFKLYRLESPNGMTLEGLRAMVARVMFGGTPLGGIKMTALELGDPEIGYPKIGGK